MRSRKSSLASYVICSIPNRPASARASSRYSVFHPLRKNGKWLPLLHSRLPVTSWQPRNCPYRRSFPIIHVLLTSYCKNSISSWENPIFATFKKQSNSNHETRLSTARPWPGRNPDQFEERNLSAQSPYPVTATAKRRTPGTGVRPSYLRHCSFGGTTANERKQRLYSFL